MAQRHALSRSRFSFEEDQALRAVVQRMYQGCFAAGGARLGTEAGKETLARTGILRLDLHIEIGETAILPLLQGVDCTQLGEQEIAKISPGIGRGNLSSGWV
jgi:hypothetical protein